MQRRDADFVKLQVFVPGALRREIGVAAEEAGQALTVWVARALAAAVLKAKSDAYSLAPEDQASGRFEPRHSPT